MRLVDQGGGWMGCLDDRPIGCILGVRYDNHFGFIGLFLVKPEHRGHGYGVALWRRALTHLEAVACIGLEAAPERLGDYGRWGFRPAHDTLRWSCTACPDHRVPPGSLPAGHRLLPTTAVPESAVAAYDARHEATPRPLFLREWLKSRSPLDRVRVVVDAGGVCRGFARIRAALMPSPGSDGWRVGPWQADDEALAEGLLADLLADRTGTVLVDAPGINPGAGRILERWGFQPVGRTIRMYRGVPPVVPMQEIYGLACLELG
jgi:ribosomal-protein-alanine N-acetyltransferase